MSYLFRSVAITLITILEYMMLIRALMSWFPMLQGNKFYEVLYQLTEPIIAPFRRFLFRIPALRGFPLDISFLLAYLILMMAKQLMYFYL